MYDKLLPCPFCGGEARQSGETFERTTLQWVYCTSCGAAGGYRHTKTEAIAAWNRRTERTCKVVPVHGGDKEVCKMVVLYRCSECGDLITPDVNYCSNCGAKVVK